jgi:hypothetical protein
MHLNRTILVRAVLFISLMANLTILSNTIKADTGSCGGATTTLPFTDVQGNIFFCHIAAAYFSGLTAGTSATTYGPTENVTREQMAAFITRTLDQSVKRGSKRAALNQWWTTTPHYDSNLGTVTVGQGQGKVASDGQDLWVVNNNPDGLVYRVRASDGKLLETRIIGVPPFGVLVAMGRVFVTAPTTTNLYMIDPQQSSGQATAVTNALPLDARQLTFDGERIWVTNVTGTISIITPGPTMPWSVTTVSGFNQPFGILYDGLNIWITDSGANELKKLDSNGNVLQTVIVGATPLFPIFDGTNIWVPNNVDNTLMVVRAATGQVIATLTGNGLNRPFQAAFDGERILVTNQNGNSVSLWNAANLLPKGSFSTGTGSPNGVCSDGINFWMTLGVTGKLARF